MRRDGAFGRESLRVERSISDVDVKGGESEWADNDGEDNPEEDSEGDEENEEDELGDREVFGLEDIVRLSVSSF